MMKSQKFHILLLLALSALLFFRNIGGYDLWPADEPRFAQVAREMMQSHNYLAPHINGHPYKEKPPLLFWLIAFASAPFGDVTEFSARSVSATAALVTVLFAYLLAARLYGPATGLWSVVILSTTALFWWEARSVRCDMLLTAWMTVALYAFWRFHESKSARWLILLYAAMAAGLLTKGPPALIFPLLGMFAFYWKRPAREVNATWWHVGTLLAVACILAWFIPARMSVHEAAPLSSAVPASAWQEFLRMTLYRFMGQEKFQWPWYYALTLPLTLLPWSLFLPWSLPWLWQRRREDERMRLLLAFTVPAFLLLSASFGKREVYLLPLYPLFAILLARSIMDLTASERVAWRKRTAAAWGALLMLGGALPFAYVPWRHPELITQGSVIFLVCVFGFGLAVVYAARNSKRSVHAAAVIAAETVMVALLAASALFPTINRVKGASEICRPLRALAETHVDFRVYTLGFSREEYIFYAKHPHTPVLTDLLKVDLPQAMSLSDMAKLQRGLRKAVAKGADSVPVASLANLTDAEIQALQACVRQTIQEAEADPKSAGAMHAVAAALTREVTRIGHEFEQGAPAFLFVMHNDWKWLVAMFPQFARHTIIDSDSVGTRDMLLVANEAGKKAIEAPGDAGRPH